MRSHEVVLSKLPAEAGNESEQFVHVAGKGSRYTWARAAQVGSSDARV